MTLEEFSDILGVNLEITRYANQENRYTASFEHTEVKESRNSGILCSSYGDGNTPECAMNDYAGKISNKWLVLNAYTDNRKEFGVPSLEKLK